MKNLIDYCVYKGIENFELHKFERKTRIVIMKHMISVEDYEKFQLKDYVKDLGNNRYQLLNFWHNKISGFIRQCQWFCEMTNEEITKAFENFDGKTLTDLFNYLSYLEDISCKKKRRLRTLYTGK
jgi:hypothetical protein